MRGALIYLARLSVMQFRCCHITSAVGFFTIYLLSCYYFISIRGAEARSPSCWDVALMHGAHLIS